MRPSRRRREAPLQDAFERLVLRVRARDQERVHAGHDARHAAVRLRGGVVREKRRAARERARRRERRLEEIRRRQTRGAAFPPARRVPFGDDAFEASAPPVTPLFKIQCGKCGCVLKIPGQIAVFRCPRCAAKLRTPPGAFADDEERRLPRREDESRDPERRRETAERTQKRDAFDEELASLRLAREALERHVAFSKSLEGVVGELVKRVPRVAA